MRIGGDRVILSNEDNGLRLAETLATPNRVKTERLGMLKFFDGMPDADTVQKVDNNLDFMHGMEAFLNKIPATSVYGLQESIKEVVGLPP